MDEKQVFHQFDTAQHRDIIHDGTDLLKSKRNRKHMIRNPQIRNIIWWTVWWIVMIINAIGFITFFILYLESIGL